MKCLILAAGYATRLYPLTENFPKPLLKVGEKTILDWLIDDLETAGMIDGYLVVTNRKFAPHFDAWAKTHTMPITVVNDGTVSNETRLGAVRDIQFVLDTQNIDDDLLVIAGDNVLDFSLTAFLHYAAEKGTSCSMRYWEPDVKRLKSSGVSQIGANERLLSLEEKPQEPKSHWCTPPFYFYTKADAAKIKTAIADGCGVDAPGSLVAWMCTHSVMHSMEMPGKRYDIGNLESYERVQKEYHGIMKKALVILAAGMGSRFGEGIKQLTPVGPNGELIIDYSIYDAIAAGFNHIVFIIRHAIEQEFRACIGDRITAACAKRGVAVSYAFQEQEHAPITVPGRTKPWGTGHAVLCAADVIDSPFAVLNADDYYGKDSFRKAAAFLGSGYAMIGFVLKNTLSDTGGVTRGICTVENGVLTAVEETRNILKTPHGAQANGKALDENVLVSMNFWCYPQSFLDVLRQGFPRFLDTMRDPLNDEYLLPVIANELLGAGVPFSVLPTDAHWFGVTYREDKAVVAASFRALHDAGVYPPRLY